MRLFRICVYGLLLVPPLGTTSCEHGQVQKSKAQACTVYISTNTTANGPTCIVSLNQCFMDTVYHSAAQEWILAANKDVVTWTNDPGETPHPHTYTVAFSPYSPFGSPANPNPPVSIGAPNKVTGGTQCDKTHPTLCNFKYTLTSDGTVCSDPGVHVDPNALETNSQ